MFFIAYNNLTHLQVTNIAYTAVMSSIWFYVLTLFTESNTIVDGTVQDRKISSQMLQKPCLFIWIFDLKELIQLLARNFKGSGYDRNRCEDRLVVGPYEEYETDVKEEQQEEGLNSRSHGVNAQLDHIRVPRPINRTKLKILSSACRANDS